MIAGLSGKAANGEKLGNKAGALMQMKRQGFAVPDGFVLDSDVFDEVVRENGLEDGIQSALKELAADNISEISEKLREMFDGVKLPEETAAQVAALTKDGQLYAVRSSGTREDMEQYSFAGQYDTYLNVPKEDLETRIIDCYRSLFGEVILNYLVNRFSAASDMSPAEELKMAVVVQEMVPSEFSGICFTINPSSGADTEMVIEVSEGLGENIVGGKTRPEQYFYDWYEQREVRRDGKNRLISEEEVKRFADVFTEIQMFFGYPCDIEFAVYGGELFILQARRITRIRYNGIEDMWTTADFKDGGVSATVCTPYMWSLYEYIWEYSLRKFIVGSQILKDEELPAKLGRMFYGRPYWNMSAVKKTMSRIIGYKEREFDNEYGIIGNYEGDGETTKITPGTLSHMLKIVVKQTRILNHRRRNAERFKSELLQIYERYREQYDNHHINSIRKDFYQLTKKIYLRSETTYFWQIFINTIHQSLYKDSLLKYVSESEYLALLGGIDDISHLLPFYEMWELSRRIRADEEVFDFWKNTDAKVIAGMLKAQSDELYGMEAGKRKDTGSGDGKPAEKDKYLTSKMSEIIEKYGYHSDKELDITYPCYYEEPEIMIGMVRDMIGLEDSYSPVEDKARSAAMYREVLHKIGSKVSPMNFRRIRKKVANMRSMLWWREEFRDVSTRFYYLLRVYTMEYAKLLAEEGVLDRWEDVWFLKVGNLWDYLDHRTDAEALREIVRKNKRYYQAYRNYMSENEIGTAFSDAALREKESGNDGTDTDALIRGLGANNGTVTGTARVIEDFSEIDRLQEGDILVTRFTDTGWTPKFAILSGIVTEYGGILCHAAIVSREYGIPAIVCCKDAMKKIKDGQIITVNGTEGTVWMEGENSAK